MPVKSKPKKTVTRQANTPAGGGVKKVTAKKKKAIINTHNQENISEGASEVKIMRQPASGSMNVNSGQKSVHLNLYRKIAYSFIILTLGLLAVIFYFSFINVKITIISNEDRIGNNLIIDVYDNEKYQTVSDGAILGVVKQIEVSDEKIYTIKGTEVIGEETTGTVTLINNYNKNQPLVATTRLLSPDNKLFRIKNTVNVPAGGSIEVEVYADEPGEDMAIGPTKFTIPGLWAGLQKDVYAENKEAFVHNTKTKNSVAQSDIDNGIKDIRKSLIKKAEKEVNDKYKDYSQRIYSMDENSVSFEVDGKVGEERDNITITMKANVVVVAFNDDKIKEMASKKLESIVASNKKLAEFSGDDIIYSLDSQNYSQGIATLNSTFEGKTILDDRANIIDREKILGLTSEQLSDYLDNEPDIAEYEIKFSPSFIDKVPNLVDRITIELKNK